MPRQSVIRIRAEITIPYDRKAMGSAANAEKHCDKIHTALFAALGDARCVKWEPEHTTVEVK